MDPVEEVYAKIEADPTAKCFACERVLNRYLFTPSQLERTNPHCRTCRNRPRGVPFDARDDYSTGESL